MTTIEIAKQVSKMIEMPARAGRMLPKTPKDIETILGLGRGFYVERDGLIVSFAAYFEWPKYLEIGSVITHDDYRHQGLAKKIVAETLQAAREYSGKPVIALTNDESAKLFESFGFRTKPRKEKLQTSFWEPCKDICVDYGRWPRCNCHLMELE